MSSYIIYKEHLKKKFTRIYIILILIIIKFYITYRNNISGITSGKTHISPKKYIFYTFVPEYFIDFAF